MAKTVIEFETEVTDLDFGFDEYTEAVAQLQSGILAEAGFLEGTDPEVLRKAVLNHFGAGTGSITGAPIPERPFMTENWDLEIQSYSDFVANAVFDAKTKDDFLDAFDDVARIAAEDIVRAIDESPSWAEFNAELTERLKGHDHPLIEEGYMRDSIDHIADWTRAQTDVKMITSAPVSSRGKSGGGRRSSLIKQLKKLAVIAKSPGYTGRGIRAAPERRSKAFEGVTSRGIRRKGL